MWNQKTWILYDEDRKAPAPDITSTERFVGLSVQQTNLKYGRLILVPGQF